MALELSDNTNTLPLWNAQEGRSQESAALDTSPIPGFESDDAFLTALQQQASVELSGVVTANRLSRDSRFDNDPETALAQWAVQLERFVNGGQGDGYTLSRNYRNDSFNGVIETAQWTRNGGEPLQLRWNVSFLRGQGTDVKNSTDIPTVSPGGDITLDGNVLPQVREFQIEKSQSWEIYRRTFAENGGDNDLGSSVGATRRIRVIGQVDGTATERNQFDADITDTLGQDTLITLRDALTGRTFEGMIDSYDATDESGLTRLNEYAIEFVEGTN